MSGPAPDICIYHASCDDGFAAAYAVWKRFGDGVKFIPAQYGGDMPDVSGKDVLIVDFSFKQPDMQRLANEAKRIIVLDHHKTAEAELSGFTRLECVGGPFEKRYADRLISGVGVCFDMNKSGCRLAWEYCFGDAPMPDWFAAVEDRDLWRFALPATKEICISIRSHPRDFKIWDGFDAGELAVEGTAIRRYVDMIVSNICDTAFVENIGGHDVPVAACSYDFVSETANQLLLRNPEAPFAACLVRSYDGITYSLRSMDDRLDVSDIAKANGGGGHRNAAGFRAKVAPPQTNVKPLEWRKGYCDERVTIHQASNGWLYQVRMLDGIIWLDWPDRAATQFPSEEQAREAAQADYASRVLAALRASPETKSPTQTSSSKLQHTANLDERSLSNVTKQENVRITHLSQLGKLADAIPDQDLNETRGEVAVLDTVKDISAFHDGLRTEARAQASLSRREIGDTSEVEQTSAKETPVPPQTNTAVPEGWKLVPRTPTDAMMQAGLYQSSHDAQWADIYSSWVDMVDAAEPPPQTNTIMDDEHIERHDLANLIKTRLINVHPDDQDLELEDEDWIRICAALTEDRA